MGAAGKCVQCIMVQITLTSLRGKPWIYEERGFEEVRPGNPIIGQKPQLVQALRLAPPHLAGWLPPAFIYLSFHTHLFWARLCAGGRRRVRRPQQAGET